MKLEDSHLSTVNVATTCEQPEDVESLDSSPLKSGQTISVAGRMVEGQLPLPAGSIEEYAETARVVGYGPGLGSCIQREE